MYTTRESWGLPGGIVVKFMCSTSAAKGLRVWILDVDLHTAHQAMLGWHPTYKKDWQQMLAQGQSYTSKKQKEEEEDE